MSKKKSFIVGDIVHVKFCVDVDRGGNAEYEKFPAIVKYVDKEHRQIVVNNLEDNSLSIVDFSEAKVLRSER